MKPVKPYTIRSEPPSELPPLSAVLPEGEDAALAFVDQITDAAKASGVSHDPAELREWLRTVVRAEHYVARQASVAARRGMQAPSGR